jgi:serine/threonine-protein kinase HipA
MLKVKANNTPSGELTYNSKDREYIFNYTHNNPISLTMPYQKKSYLSHYNLHPIFDMSMPEGYLFSLLKNLLIKEYGEMNDFILFEHLSQSIEGYLSYQKDKSNGSTIKFRLQDILEDEDENLFLRLVEQFLNQSAIAGVQPKVLAQLQDKATLSTKEYIVKSFSSEYPHLAENEFFCMKALSYANIRVPKFWLSKSKKLFVMEKFTYQKGSDSFYGFEEFCVLFGYTKEQKYRGSYEQIAKAINKISTNRKEDIKEFYKITVMNYLLKNGDAHLKNFGILYTSDKESRFLAPAYDVVNTVIYLPRDKPALMLGGKKVWWDRERVIEFGIEYAQLSPKEAEDEFDICIKAIKKIDQEIAQYIKANPRFLEFGAKFRSILEFSLEKNINQTYKDIYGVL